MGFLGRLLLWLGGLLAVGTLAIAWRIGLHGFYGVPMLFRWIALGVVVGSVVCLALGLLLTAPPKGPKAAKEPKAPKPAKGKKA